MPYKNPEKKREWDRKNYNSPKRKAYRESAKGKAIHRRANLKDRLSGKKRNRQLKELYNSSIEEYMELFRLQNGCCAVCGRSQFEKSLCIDHDHKTGKIRGLLCNGCNLRLGWYEKNKEVINIYLE